MNHHMRHAALFTLMIAGITACAADRSSSPPIEPMRPTFQSQSPVIEGQVIRNEGNAYVIRELSGRQTRILFDNNTMKDPIAVGDTAMARYDGPSSSAYATSITRSTSQPALLTANNSPLLQTVEGIVQQQDGNDFVIKEHSGRDVRFQVDNMTKLDRDIRIGDRVVVGTDGRDMRLQVDHTTRFDRNITVGDKVMAMTNPMPSEAPYVTTMHRLDSLHLVQGEVVRVDETGYLVRDLTGRDVRLQTNSATVRNDGIRVGDRIIADTDSSSTVHVDSIAKR